MAFMCTLLFGCQVFHTGTGEREGRLPHWYRHNEAADVPVLENKNSTPVEADSDFAHTPSSAGSRSGSISDFGQRKTDSEFNLRQGEAPRARRSVGSSPSHLSEGRNRSPDKARERRRQGSCTDGVGGVLCKIHDLADHLQKHVSSAFVNSVLVGCIRTST